MGNPVEHECVRIKESHDQVVTRCFSRYGDLYLGNEGFICKVNYCGICGYEYNKADERSMKDHAIFKACRNHNYYCHRSMIFGDLLFSNGFLSSPVKRCPFCGLYSDEESTR